MARDMNRLKVVLAETKRTNRWLASCSTTGRLHGKNWARTKPQFPNGVPIPASQALKL